ncbi:MAG: IS110 family transposase [Mariprofundaceae bacterium]|nr:IS110 family transposase [Mariprofundaceae bacterium]
MKDCGIDMACKSSSVCITDEQGVIVAEFELPTDEDGFRTGLSRWDGLHCVIEASPLAEWVARILEGLGHQVVVIDPRRAKAVICTKKKTDKLDARNLAKMGRTGWYTAVHRKSPEARLLRTHMQARVGLVQTSKAQASRIRGLLRSHGIKLGKVSEGEFANKVRAMIMKRQPELLPILEPLLSIWVQAKIEARKMQKEIKLLSTRDDVCAQLMTAPGVGPLVVSAYVATIDDPKRFSSGDEIAAYIGLVPSVHRACSQRTSIGGNGVSRPYYQGGGCHVAIIAGRSGQCFADAHETRLCTETVGLGAAEGKRCWQGQGSGSTQAGGVIASHVDDR